MQSIKVTFKNSHNVSLAGILNLPKKPSAYALFAHCFTCSKDIPTAYHICKTLTQNNIATLRFDFTGLGDSEGEFSDTHFSSNIEDILAAANFLESNYYAPTLLIGHSLGGTAILAAATKLKNVQAIATIASPHTPSHVLQHVEEAVETLKKQDSTTIHIMQREFHIKKEFIADLHSYENSNFAEKLAKPLLIMHSPSDNVVSIQEATKVFSMAKHPKNFISLDNIDHMLSNKKDATYVANLIYAWAKKYISSE